MALGSPLRHANCRELHMQIVQGGFVRPRGITQMMIIITFVMNNFGQNTIVLNYNY